MTYTFGPFTVQNVTRMNYDAALNANRLVADTQNKVIRKLSIE